MAESVDTLTDDAGKPQDDKQRPSDVVKYWTDQLGAYDDEFKDWVKRCKKIIRRYRDERGEKSDGTVSGAWRFNSLWSNVQTLQPAIYIKPPQPVVERRYLDKDPLARTASMTLERACEVQIEVGKLHPAMRKAVLDYLLCGRGTLWERYEPTYGEAQDLGPAPEQQPDAVQAAAEPARPVTYEKVCDDYVAWDKFKHSPASVWDDVWWVGKEEMLTRKELRARWPDAKDQQTGKLIADLIPMRNQLASKTDQKDDREKKRRNPRALVVEIWNKRDRQVLFIAPDYPDAPLEIRDDPLGLDGFWPCPPPLYATVTNDTLVPIPDYSEYQDQAEELDNLTQRIKALTDAVRVNGVYDASIPELRRILQEGAENRMIGVKNWAELTTKGGLSKSMDFVPLKDVVEALLELYNARDRVKADMAEITGISDIIRGQSQGSNKTATEQRIKGQFASLRLDDRKKEVARFARDAIAIKAEIIAEQFSPEILAEMTGMIAFLTDEIKAEQPPAPPPQAAPPQMGHNGGPPMVDAPPLAPAPVPPPPDPAMLAQQRFSEGCDLLKNDKMRTFRIDIETDSTVEPDRQAAKEAVNEMTAAVGLFLEKAVLIAQAQPVLVPALAQTLLFVLRTYAAGRDVEGAWEAAVQTLERAAKNPAPKPPSPEEIEAQAEQRKQEMETEREQMKAELEKRKAEQDFALEQEKARLEIERERMKLEIEREKIAMERERMQMKIAADQQAMAIKSQAAERDAAIDERAAVRGEQLAEREDERAAEAGERQFELDRKTAEAKAKEAQKPKAKEPA